MSWQEQDRMSLKKEFVLLAMQEGSQLSELSKRFNISRKTGYKWLNRYMQEGITGLSDKPKTPHTSPIAVPQNTRTEIIKIKERHSSWGARKIHAVLKRQNPEDCLPAVSTIHKVLLKAGYTTSQSQTSSCTKRFEHDAPNRLWQMDFKGHFAYEKGRCHPHTILDDHSRFSLGLTACRNERKETVQAILTEVFRQYGLPERINVDNGSPWGNAIECAKYTDLTVWLIQLGVTVSHSRIYHPQTNGKVERFHRTLKQELLKRHYFRSIEHIQHAFNHWRDIYNLERPHEGIDMQVPAQRYQPSYRRYPVQLPTVNYTPDYIVYNTDSRGRISMEGRQIFIGTPFSKQLIGVRQNGLTGAQELFFCHQKLGEVNLNHTPKKVMVNLYSGRVTSL